MGLSNSQHDAIMRVYNARQFRNKREQDRRTAAVYGAVPEIGELSDEIAADMAQAGRLVLRGDTEGAEKLRAQAEEKRAIKRAFLLRAGYPADELELRYECPDCRDTGYANGKKCHCFRRMEIEILYDQSNIRNILEHENFDTLTMDGYDRETIDPKSGMTVYDYMSMVIKDCHAFVERFADERGSILFTGNTGCGKTFLSNCIARELIRRYFSVVYLNATDLFDVLSEQRFGDRDDETAKDRAAYVLECDLLIIDDLGTELINTFTASQLFYCVNERLNRRRGTIISTNLTLDRLQDAFTERVTSRIMSRYQVMPLIGSDLRFMERKR